MSDSPDRPLGFGYKCVWLAIREDNALRVADSLGLRDVRACNWLTGYRAIYGDDRALIFVTPPLHGWVLAAGWGLPTFEGPKFPDTLTPLLDRLGKAFPDVQHFATHRVVGFQSWSRAVAGRIVRSFVYLGESGEILRDVGEADEAERMMLEGDRKIWQPTKYNSTYEFYPSEEHVIKMAAAWSIDPTNLDEMNLPASCGLLGRL